MMFLFKCTVWSISEQITYMLYSVKDMNLVPTFENKKAIGESPMVA